MIAESKTDPTGGGLDWRTVAVIAALALVVWWVWKERSKTKPDVAMRPNVSPAPVPPPGIPLDLSSKMARVVDTAIPVVMTSGRPVPYDEDEVGQLVRRVLARLNSMGENVSLIKVISVSKTQDSYKTVTYDLVISVFDATNNVGMMLTVSILIPVSGAMYVREFRLYHRDGAVERGPNAASDPSLGTGGFAAFEDPAAVLAKMKIS